MTCIVHHCSSLAIGCNLQSRRRGQTRSSEILVCICQRPEPTANWDSHYSLHSKAAGSPPWQSVRPCNSSSRPAASREFLASPTSETSGASNCLSALALNSSSAVRSNSEVNLARNGCTPFLETEMDQSFLSFVEERWDVLRRSPGSGHIRSVASRPEPTTLEIRIETNEAKATITARSAMKSLAVSVHRFKDQRVLSDGPCGSMAEADRRLQSLWVELSASPFA